jgi:hypothetical protein
MMHYWRATLEARRIEKKKRPSKEDENIKNMQKITSPTKVYKWHAICMLHSELWWQYFCTLHSTKCKTLNLKLCELHLDLTLTLIPNQSYARMHWLCVEYAYAYSYCAYYIHPWVPGSAYWYEQFSPRYGWASIIAWLFYARYV